MKRFSFWKPNPVPRANDPIVSATLEPLGAKFEVIGALLSIPGTFNLYPGTDPSQILWDMAESVVLEFKEDSGSLAPGQVLVIDALSEVKDSVFYRLYVQVFERFSVVLLDEKGAFLSPRQFRASL